jgi:uncharacterized protein (TIGR02271 family)
LQLRREELVVGTRQVEGGGALLRKTVRTQEVSRPVELRREEISIQRNAADSQPGASADFQPREIRIDLMREEPVVSTRSYIAEIVRVRKQTQTDTENVAGKVRREELEIVELDRRIPDAVGGTGDSDT